MQGLLPPLLGKAGWAILDPGGGDSWKSISSPGPFLSQGLYAMGCFQAGPWQSPPFWGPWLWSCIWPCSLPPTSWMLPHLILWTYDVVMHQFFPSFYTDFTGAYFLIQDWHPPPASTAPLVLYVNLPCNSTGVAPQDQTTWYKSGLRLETGPSVFVTELMLISITQFSEGFSEIVLCLDYLYFIKVMK